MSSAEPKVAVVTGAARGIGRAIAEALLEVGWHCAVTDVRPFPTTTGSSRP